MGKHIFLRWFVSLFSVQRRRDLVIKPLFLLVGVLVTRFSVQALIADVPVDGIATEVVITTLVAIPFLALGTLLVTYLDGLQTQLAELAMTDVLTGLPNRRAFFDGTRERFAGGASGYLLILDADHFKMINDRFGHAVGDVCLQALAAHLRQEFDNFTLIGRIGGEEFAAFAPAISRGQLNVISDRLVGPIPITHPDLRDPIEITASIGATDVFGANKIEEALQRADMALYRAKSAGRARMEFEPSRRKHRDDVAA